LFYAYVQAGSILTGGCFFTYFRTFQSYGISAADIFAMNNQFFPSADGQDYTNGTGTVLSSDDQNFILTQIYSSWYMMIFCGQVNIKRCNTFDMIIIIEIININV
jgi:hypothetical protein